MGKQPLASKWEKFVWKRPCEVYGEGEYYLFNEIKPDDIKQGYCGDCYFLSALSALAEFPERVEKIFKIKTLNSAGIYAVTLYITGEERTVFVDDYFPYYSDKNQWAFTRSNGNEIWVLILEKAWAKVHGSYQRIEGGNTAEALMALTGCNVDYIFHSQVQNKNAIWDRIDTANQSNYVMSTAASGIKTGKKDQQLKQAGIVDAHAYSLIDTYTLVTADKQKVRLVKLRNPWGFEEWKGDWSDYDEKNWTSELKKKVKFEAKDDGVFFMSFDDYLEFYYTTSICKYESKENFNIYSDKDTTKEFSVFKFNLKSKSKGKVYISVNQINSRFNASPKDKYEYAGMKLMVAKVSGDNLKFIDGDAVIFNCVQFEAENLPSGDYLVFVNPKWDAIHTCKNLVCTLNVSQDSKIQRVFYKKYSHDILGMLQESLSERIAEGKDYARPSLEDKEQNNDATKPKNLK